MNKKGKRKSHHDFRAVFPRGKKGLMVKFLVTILLALIIFLPACMGVSKLFKTSRQAQNNFQDFGKALVEFEKKAIEGEIDSEILILDKDVVVYIFQNHQDYFQHGVKIRYSQGKCKGQPCAVLCQELTENDAGVEDCTKITAFPLGEGKKYNPFLIARREITYNGHETKAAARRTRVKFMMQQDVVTVSYN